MVKQTFQTKANRLKELKNVYKLFPLSCATPTSPVSCCKMLQVFVLDDFFRCLHSFLNDSCYFLHVLHFDLRCEHLLVCRPDSSQMSHVDGCSYLIQYNLLKTLSNLISIRNDWFANLLNLISV